MKSANRSAIKMASSSMPAEPCQGQSSNTSTQFAEEQPAAAPVPVAQVDDCATAGVGLTPPDIVEDIRQLSQASESLSERRLRRIREAEENLRKARARARRAQVADEKKALIESTKMLKGYVRSLPTDGKFTLEVLLRLGGRAEAVGATPADVFGALEEISKVRSSRS